MSLLYKRHVLVNDQGKTCRFHDHDGTNSLSLNIYINPLMPKVVKGRLTHLTKSFKQTHSKEIFEGEKINRTLPTPLLYISCEITFNNIAIVLYHRSRCRFPGKLLPINGLKLQMVILWTCFHIFLGLTDPLAVVVWLHVLWCCPCLL